MAEAVAELEHVHDEAEEASAPSPCMQKLNRLEWMPLRSHRFGVFDVGIRTTSAAFDDWMAYALKAYRTDAETEPNYSVVIRNGSDDVLTRRRPHTLYRITATMLKTVHLRTVGRTLLDDLGTLVHAFEEDDSLYAEVGAIEVGEKTAVIPLILWSYFNGQTRRVKSLGAKLSTARIHRLDLRLPQLLPLSTDRLRIPGDALDRLAVLDSGANGSADRMLIDEPRPVDAVFVWGNIDRPVLPVSRGYAARELAVSTVNLASLGQEGLDAVAGFLEATPTFCLNADTVPRMLEALVGAIERL